MKSGDVVPAIVTAADGAAIQLRAGALHVTIDRKGFAWTGKTAGTPARDRAATSSKRGWLTVDDAATHRHRHARADAHRRRRGARDRQSHRSDHAR